MPRASCNWYGCSERPLLTVPRRFVDDHVAYLVRTGQLDLGGLCSPLGSSPVLDADGERRWHPRLCREHAAEVGVEQLDTPRHHIQGALV